MRERDVLLKGSSVLDKDFGVRQCVLGASVCWVCCLGFCRGMCGHVPGVDGGRGSVFFLQPPGLLHFRAVFEGVVRHYFTLAEDTIKSTAFDSGGTL